MTGAAETVEVTSVGTGKVLDTWTFDGTTITVGPGDLDDILESLQARFADDATLWAALDGGWSNGHIRVAPPEGDPAADEKPETDPEPVAAKPRTRRQADRQLVLPIAAATEEDDRLHRDYEAALAALLAAWPAAAAPLVDDLATQAAAGGLAGLAASATTVSPIETALAEALTGLSTRAATDLGTQAVDAGAADEVPLPDEGQMVELAVITASLLAGAYAAAATRRALLAPAGAVADTVRTALTDMSTSERGVVADNLGVALSMAQGHGRMTVLAAVPAAGYMGVEDAEPATNRCPACTAAHGRRYDTLAEALQDRPNSLQLAACAGGARCRGWLVPLWQ